MTDKQIVEKLIAKDPIAIENFFFVRCRGVLCYIGQYFFRDKQTPEELIGEFYEFLSADDWHKLRIFRYTCSLNSYITIIASRYFQHERDKELLPLDENIALVNNLKDDRNSDNFFMEDLNNIIRRLHPFDRFLVQRILVDGEKPGNVLDEAEEIMRTDGTISIGAQNRKQLAGYIYTRYNRVRRLLQKSMIEIGYEG